MGGDEVTGARLPMGSDGDDEESDMVPGKSQNPVDDGVHAVGGEEQEPGLELLMPFVTVASKGGPHDDVSYAAGWEMGALDAELQFSPILVSERVIHTSNEQQADLIAMRHGYRAEIEATHIDGWSTLRLTRSGVD